MARAYDQYCPIARALETIGEQWTLLIVRELKTTGPRRYTDLLNQLPGISPTLLSRRLKDLQASGVITRRELPPPAPAAVYELTDLGHELLPVLRALGRWGLHFLPQHGGTNWREGLQRRAPIAIERAGEANETHEVIVEGELLGFRIQPGVFEVSHEPVERPLARLTVDAKTFVELILLFSSVEEAEAAGRVHVEGDRKAAQRLIDYLALPTSVLAPAHFS